MPLYAASWALFNRRLSALDLLLSPALANAPVDVASTTLVVRTGHTALADRQGQ